MTGGGAAAGAAAAAAAAAEQRRRQQAEEEEMTSYAKDDLDGWEFKILRASTARFKDPIGLRAILSEEAQAGWELVEKFDNQRLRLKRSTRWREKDRDLPFDPYRSHVGMSSNALAGWIVAGVVVVLALIAGIAAAITS